MSVVTDELLERFAREYYANSPRCPYDPETARTAPMDVAYLRTSEDGVAMAAALAAVAPLIAQAERERCSKWHDEQAAAEDALAKAALGLDDDDYRHHRHIGREHRHAAAAIRALGDEA